jgi:hypothetical protein
VSDQRELLRGRLASFIDSVADVASQLDPPAARPIAPPPPPAPPSRAWSLAAAMEPIATPLVEHGTAPANALPPLMPPDVAPPMDPPSHHHFPAKVLGSGVLGLIGLIVIAVAGLHLFHAAPPTRAPATDQIALTAVRPVAASPPAGGQVPPTQVSFPSGTGTVSIEVSSGTTSGQAPVEILVSGGQPPVTVSDHDYVLDASGATLIALTAPGGTFAPGDYSVTISSNGATIGSTAFEVR